MICPRCGNVVIVVCRCSTQSTSGSPIIEKFYKCVNCGYVKVTSAQLLSCNVIEVN